MIRNITATSAWFLHCITIAITYFVIRLNVSSKNNNRKVLVLSMEEITIQYSWNCIAGETCSKHLEPKSLQLRKLKRNIIIYFINCHTVKC